MKKSIELTSLSAEVANLIQSKGYDFGVSLTYTKEIKCNKKDRKTGVPFTGKIEQVQKYSNLGFGADYGNAVRNRLSKQGLSTDFQPESLPYGEWAKGFERKALFNNQGELQVRFYAQANTTCETICYLLNGVEVSKDQLPDVLPAPRKSTSKKQADAGLAPELQAKPRNMFASGLTNIKGTKF
jgi:hypothetical protein